METIKNFKNLIAFEKVAKLASYSKAAKELNVSKAYVSKMIQELENELGQRLFNRSTRVVQLTTVGEKFYQACSTSFHSINKALDEVQSKSDLPSGKLRISVAGVFGEEFISPLVFEYLKKYPNVKIELVFEERIVDLIKDSYDFAIRVGHLKDSSLISRKIATRKVYICATPNYLNLHGIPKSPEELKKHNCLSLKENWSFIINNKRHSLTIGGNYKSNNGRTLLKAALSDLGICYLPGEYVLPHIENGNLISILESYTPEEIPIWLLSPSKRNISKTAETFAKEISYISQSFQRK